MSVACQHPSVFVLTTQHVKCSTCRKILTDTDRILRPLRRGQRIGPAMFMAPRVLDGGKPITRLAARIKDLRNDGRHISSSRARNGTALYVMDDVAAMDGGLENSDASPLGTPETASPERRVAVQQAPADAVAPPTAVAPPPSSRDHASDLLDSAPLFDSDEFRQSTTYREGM